MTSPKGTACKKLKQIDNLVMRIDLARAILMPRLSDLLFFLCACLYFFMLLYFCVCLYLVRGRVDDLSFFDYLSPFLFFVN